MSRYSARPLCVTGWAEHLTLKLLRSSPVQLHFLDTTSRDLFICAKDLFVGAKHGWLKPYGSVVEVED
jgi:hypothetical protein